MKAVILAGGRGTRLSEETQVKPKPLVEAGGQPLIWHIMQNYALFGITEFIVLSGYKGQLIREYFANFWLHQADITFDLSAPNQQIHRVRSVPWNVSVIDTGLDTNTGGRILKLREILTEEFLLTYGDGVSDVNISNLIHEHTISNNIVTLTGVRPPSRFGSLETEGSKVLSFQEKSVGEESWINGGFMVVKPDVFSYLDGDSSSFEINALTKIAKQGLLGVYKHQGYWQPVDTIRDLQNLEEAISDGMLPWI
jgi:glucose-1-phosphate cytidylyltransferase